MTTPAAQSPDADAHKGALEQESRHEEGNTSLSGQLPHRNRSPLSDSLDSDFPEPGMNPEHTGQRTGPDSEGSRQLNPNQQGETRETPRGENHESDVNPEAEQQDQDPGQRQKRNQADKKDDSLAA